jgi:hypothetical protein
MVAATPEPIEGGTLGKPSTPRITAPKNQMTLPSPIQRATAASRKDSSNAVHLVFRAGPNRQRAENPRALINNGQNKDALNGVIAASMAPFKSCQLCFKGNW